jgi:FLVCR family feline leukemia virus subgroup C receptor-related protein
MSLEQNNIWNGSVANNPHKDIVFHGVKNVDRQESYGTASTTHSAPYKREEVRTFVKRWVVLTLFCLLSMTNAFQWIQYSVINNIVVRYYGVTSLDVNGTSIIWMVVYIPCIFPATWFLDKYGLRWSVLLGAFGNCLGAWIKCASTSPHLFYVTFIGQTVVAVSQVFILNVPPRLAAIWFGPKQVSTATSLGVFGNQLGCAIGFLIPPQVVRNPDVDAAESDFIDGATIQLQEMFFGTAGITTLIFLLIIIFFSDAPKVPPSLAQQASIEYGIDRSFLHTLKLLLKNTNYVMLAVTYGLIAGGYYAFSTLLNQIVLSYFPGDDVTVGWVGVVIVLAGMVGSVACGAWLDWTKMFRVTLIAVYGLTFVGMLLFTFTLSLSLLWLVFVLAAFLGFFLTGYLPLGFEFGVEITHPLSEGTSSGLMNMCSQVCAITMIFLMQYLINDVGSVLGCNLVVAVALGIGTFITLFIKADLKRYHIENHRATVRDSVSSTNPISNLSTSSNDQYI